VKGKHAPSARSSEKRMGRTRIIGAGFSVS
jgi:hypothetical protein